MTVLLERPPLERRVQLAIQRDPARFISQVLGFHPWSMQVAIAESVRDNARTAVRSCNGSGKTSMAAAIVVWFLAAHPYCRVVTTAPTFTQVRDLLWTEIASRCANAPPGLLPSPTDTRLELAENWFALGMSTDLPERFAGHHAEHLLLVVDEASGVKEMIYEAGEGFLTSAGGKVLLIGNPTQTAGTFYRAFTSERHLYQTHHISAFDTPNLTGEAVSEKARQSLVRADWPAERAAAWGVDSPLYQVRVLGNFSQDTDDTIISLTSVETAQHYTAEPDDVQAGHVVTIACDVARFGSDETVLMRKRGPRCETIRIYNGRDTMATAGYCLAATIDALAEPGVLRCRVVVDDDGVGGGVVDRLRETIDYAGQGRAHVTPFRGGEKPLEPERFTNARTEAWFRTKHLLAGLDIPNDDQLAADLVSTKYKMTSLGQIQAEKKDDVKKRLGRSPDRADALVMLLVPDTEATDLSDHFTEEEPVEQAEW